jgi:hypothetical protein
MSIIDAILEKVTKAYHYGLRVQCPVCNAVPGEQCFDVGVMHAQRIKKGMLPK